MSKLPGDPPPSLVLEATPTLAALLHVEDTHEHEIGVDSCPASPRGDRFRWRRRRLARCCVAGAGRTSQAKRTVLKDGKPGGPASGRSRTQAPAFSGFGSRRRSALHVGADGDERYIYAIDLKTQKKLWNTELGPRPIKNGYGDGPRGTPTVDGDLVYGIGGQGNLICVRRRDRGNWSG